MKRTVVSTETTSQVPYYFWEFKGLANGLSDLGLRVLGFKVAKGFPGKCLVFFPFFRCVGSKGAMLKTSYAFGGREVCKFYWVGFRVWD